MTNEEYTDILEYHGQKSNDTLFEKKLLLDAAGGSDEVINQELGLSDNKPSVGAVIPINNWWLKQKEEWVGKEFDISGAIKKGVGLTLHNASSEWHDKETAFWGWADPALKAHDPQNYPDERHIERAISTLTMIGVDLPRYLLGAIPGVAATYHAAKLTKSPTLVPMGGAYTSGFLVDSLKYMYLEALSRGEVKDFNEWWDIYLTHGVKAGHEAGLTLAVTAGATRFVGGMGLKGKLGPLPVTKDAAAKFAAQYISLLGMGSLINEEMPNKDDSIHVALTLLPFNIGLFKGSGRKTEPTKQKKMIDNKTLDPDNIKNETFSPQEIVEWIGEKKTRLEDFVTKNVYRFREDVKKTEVEITNLKTELKELVELEKKESTTIEIKEARNNRIIEIERTLRELGELEGPEVRRNNRDIKIIKDRIKQLETELGETAIEGKKTPGQRRMEDIIMLGKREELVRLKNELAGLEEFTVMIHAAETFNLMSEQTDRILSPAQKHIAEITNLDNTVSKKVLTIPSWNNIRNQWLDRKYPLKRVIEEAREVGVEFVEGAPTAYTWARLMPGQLGKVFHFTDYGTFDFAGKPLGKSAKEVYRFILEQPDYKERVARMEDSAHYLVALRIVEIAEEKGIRKGITDAASVEWAKQTVKELEAQYGKEIKDFSKDYTEFTQAAITYGEGAGLFPPGTAKYLAEHNKNFVSFKRVLKIDEKTGLPIRDSSGNLQLNGKVKSPIYTMKGTEKKYQVHDPHKTIFENAQMTILMAEQNFLLNEFITTIEAARKIDPKFYEDVVYKKGDKNYGKEKLLSKNEDTKALDLDIEVKREPYYFNPEGYRRGETEIVFFRNGVREVWEVGKEFSDALRSQDPIVSKLHNAWWTAPTKWLRAGAVLKPEFSMVRNPLRGTLEASLWSKNNFIPVWDTAIGAFFTMKGIKSGERTPLYQDFVKGGGLQSFITTADRTFLNRDVQAILKQQKWHNRLTPGHAWEFLRVMSEHVETWTRVGDFRKSLPRIKKEYPHLSEKEALAMAALEAREVGLDFQKGGIQSMRLNAVSEFFNPKILGKYKIIETFADRPGRLSLNITRFVVLPTILNYMINNDWKDNPEVAQVYADLDENDKWLHWHWIEGSGDDMTVYRVVKGYDIVSFFSNATRALMDHFKQEDPVALDLFVENFVKEHVGPYGSTLLPIPTIVKPALQAATNRNLFFGNRIVPRYMEDNIEAPYQYNPNTTAFSIYIGEKIGELTENKFGSPLKIDDAIATWTGGLGTDILRYTEKFLQSIGVPIPSFQKPWSKDWEKNLHEFPVIKALVKRYPNANFGQIQKIYKVYDKAKTKVANYKRKEQYDDDVFFETGVNSYTAQEYLSDAQRDYYEDIIEDAELYLEVFNDHSKQLRMLLSLPKGSKDANELFDEIEEIYKLMAWEAREGWDRMKWYLNNTPFPVKGID